MSFFCPDKESVIHCYTQYVHLLLLFMLLERLLRKVGENSLMEEENCWLSSNCFATIAQQAGQSQRNDWV